MRWSDLKLEQFLAINEVNNSDEFDKLCNQICILFNYKPSTLNRLPVFYFRWLLWRISKLQKQPAELPQPPVKLSGFKIDYNPLKYHWRQWVEIQTFAKDKERFNENINKILASATIKNPPSGHIKRSKKLFKAPYLLAASSAIKVLEEVAKINELYGFKENKEEEQEVNEAEEKIFIPNRESETDLFQENWGWLYSTVRVKEHRGITLEAVYELTAQQVLHDLQYLVAFDKNQERLVKNASPDNS